MLDQMVQGVLISRVVLYWTLCLVATSVAAWIWSVWTEPQPPSFAQSFLQLWPALVGSLLVLPLAIADMLRVSCRFVGPVLRLRNAMKRVVMGDPVEPVQPRAGDYWGDVIGRYNEMQRRLNARRTEH